MTPSEARIGVVMLLVVLLACWLSNQLFAGRAAFLLVGAMIFAFWNDIERIFLR